MTPPKRRPVSAARRTVKRRQTGGAWGQFDSKNMTKYGKRKASGSARAGKKTTAKTLARWAKR